MNLSAAWIDVLKSDGHDAVHWQELGSPSARDEEILEHAVAEERIILTADLDFGGAVVRQRLTAPAVAQLRSGSLDPDEIGALVLAAIREAGEALAGGAVLTIDKDSFRLRHGQPAISPADHF